MVKVEVVGQLRTLEYARAARYTRLLGEEDVKEITGKLEADWNEYVQAMLPLGVALPRETKAIVKIDGEAVESMERFAAWVTEHTGRSDLPSDADLQQEAEAEYLAHLLGTKHKYVLWELTIGEGSPQRMVLELDHQNCPKTVEHFLQLACGSGFLQYKGSFIHRVVPDGYIEGGLLKTSSGKRTNTGPSLLDENYAYKHSLPGTIGLSRSVSGHSGSAFYITLRPLSSLDTKNVAFGRVVEGLEILHEIAHLPCKNQRPLMSCKIVKSGAYLKTVGKIWVVTGTGEEPRTQLERTRTLSKLESADVETLLQRREAIVKDLEKTQEELEEQEAVLSLVLDVLRLRDS